MVVKLWLVHFFVLLVVKVRDLEVFKILLKIKRRGNATGVRFAFASPLAM